jgi:hypothetical protein
MISCIKTCTDLVAEKRGKRVSSMVITTARENFFTRIRSFYSKSEV